MKSTIRFNQIFDITPEFIRNENIQGILVDMDNTLLPWNDIKISKETFEWIDSIKLSKIKICIITNSGKERTSTVMTDTNLDYIHTAFKPFPFSFIRGRKILGVKRENICVIGDQMITDALGSKILGYKCIIVNPMSPKEQKGTAINRFFERLLFGRDVRDTYNDK